MIGIIGAVTINGIIGTSENKLPFNYPEDMKHFKETTTNSIVVMGRKTFESIGKPLPKRENIVITSTNIDCPGVTCLQSIRSAIQREKTLLRDRQTDMWLIGGASIYEEGLLYADKILLTLTSDYNNSKNAVRFPWINPSIFWCKGSNYIDINNPNKLMICEYERIKPAVGE